MAGRGERFVNGGYEIPKPLIEISGKTMIETAIESLNIDGDYIFITYKYSNVNFNKKLDKILNKYSKNIIQIDYITDGPACSALLAKNLINLEEELIITNCDQIMNWKSNEFINFCHKSNSDGIVVTYESNTEKNSYIKVDDDGFGIELAEKKVISNLSLNGIHYWKKGKYFVDSSEIMIKKNIKVNGEFYISLTYNELINMGFKVVNYHIDQTNHNAVGTPNDLEIYKNKKNTTPMEKQKIIYQEKIIDSNEQELIINHFETNIFGLKYYPVFEEFDNTKHPWYVKYGKIEDPNHIDFYGPYVSLYWTSPNPPSKHFSDCNAKKLETVIESMSNIDSILEIGVHRPDDTQDISSTKIIFEKKSKDAIYLGVDINDKSNFDNLENNINTLICDSSNRQLILDKLNSLDVDKLDLIFIDGDHSMFYALNDWKFAELLKVGGKIIYHDTNAHTGPKELAKAIDTSIFSVELCCLPNGITHDHGLGIFTRLK